jgi:hypothetical protein
VRLCILSLLTISDTGIIFYDRPPNFTPVVRVKAGEVTMLPPHLPLLDRTKSSASRVRQPFYNGLFQETNPTGAVRQSIAPDVPGTNFPVIQGDTGSTFQRIDLTTTFRMFLVCVDKR